MLTIAIPLHVGAGAIWVLSSIAIALTRRAPRWGLGLQTSAALVTIAAGIYLWHARHAGPQGAREHLLTIGTFCALIALGLQVGVAGPILVSPGMAPPRKLEAGGLVLFRASAGFLVLAAAAMVASYEG